MLRYRVEPVTLDETDPDDGRPIETARMVADGQRDDLQASQVLNSGGSDREPAGIDRASDFLEYALADGEVAKAELVARAEAQGFSAKTLDRAATRLGVTRQKRGFPAYTWWSL